MKKYFFKSSLTILSILFTALHINAQNDSSKAFTFSGYGEVYGGYDFSNPSVHERPDFLYNHKKTNEANLNLLLAKVAYAKKNVRANLALMAGNYATYNLASEPTIAQYINEANIGFRLSKKQNIWLNAGIMPSHIGFESAISADCWTLTRSILAENSPYYETGLKLSYTNKKENFSAAALLLNGWQRIETPENFERPSFGVQLSYKPNAKLILNYSNFIGNNTVYDANVWRTFHNLYGIYEPTKHLGFTGGFDIGTDFTTSKNIATWYSPVLIMRYTINDKFKLAARWEYYHDPKEIIITTNTLHGFKTYGNSLNFDYQITSKLLWRIETKGYYSRDNIFNTQNDSRNYSICSSLSIRL